MSRIIPALFLLAVSLVPRHLLAEEAPAPEDGSDVALHLVGMAPEKAKSSFEVTVATELGFPMEDVGDYDDDINLVATSSVVVMVEAFVFQWLHVNWIYDMPVTPETRTIAGEIVQKVLPSRTFLGATLTAFYLDFGKTSRIEFQGIGAGGITLEANPKFVPMFIGRMVLLQDATEGVDIYFGGFYQGVINKGGIMYGVGYRF